MADTAMAHNSAVRKLIFNRLGLVAALVLFFSLPRVPWVEGNFFTVGWAMCSAMVGLSMNVLAGYAGQISLAHAVLFGTGAFTLGNLATRADVPWLLSLPAAGLVTAAIALLIGFPALRIRGLHLAIATLGFQFVMQRVVFRTQFLTGGTAGVDIEFPTLFGLHIEDKDFLYLIAGAMVLLWALDRNLTRSMTGRAFFALRQDEQVAASFGIPVARYKLLAFAISGFYAGIAGGLFGTLQGDVSNELFEFIFSIEFLVFAVLGGLGSRAGTAVGAAFPVFFRNILDFLRFSGALLGGMLLVFTLLRYRGGMAAQGREIRDSARLLASLGPVFFLVFWGILAITLGSAILLPAALWAILGFVYSLTSLPLIILGLATAVVVSTVLQDLITKIATSPRTPASTGVLYTIAAIGSVAFLVGMAFVVRLLLFLAYVSEQSHDVGGSIAIGAVLALPLFLFAVRNDIKKRAAALEQLAAAAAAAPDGTVEAIVDAEAVDQIARAVSFRRSTGREPYQGALLEVENLAMHFGGVRALDGVSMEVREGELIGIMGPNGSGKTTMLNCISGFLTPTFGDVRFRGESLLKKPPHTRARLGLGRTFQNVGLVKQETVFDNFMIAQHLACRYGPMEGLMRTGTVLSEERRMRGRAAAAVEMLGLGDIVGEAVSALPHGRAKLVELGCALVTGPEILLLDEPAAGVSPQEADALGETLKRIAADFRVTILMIEHHVPLMLSTCDYIYVLNFGQLLTHGEPGEVARHPDVIAAYLGTTGKEASLATAGNR